MKNRRLIIGIIALVLLAVAGYLWCFRPDGDFWTTLCGACVRVGAVMAALWLAFPSVSRVPGWIYGIMLVGGIVVAVRPKWIVWVGPALVALWILRPRPQKKTAVPQVAKQKPPD